MNKKEYLHQYYLVNKDLIKSKTRHYRMTYGRKEDPERVKATAKIWYDKNRDRVNKKRRDRKGELKLEVFNVYGGPVCACCGEKALPFLTIDHIHGGGREHRRIIGGGHNFYSWLKKNHYPTGYQVLCMNCNFGKRMNEGICPHKEMPNEKETSDLHRRTIHQTRPL